MQVCYKNQDKMIALIAIIITMFLLVPVVKGNEYTDPQDRYSIWYPVGWDQSEYAGVDVVFMHPLEDEFRENINILSVHASDAKNSESYIRNTAEDAIEELKQQFSDITVVSGPMTQEINEHWAATYLVDLEFQGITVRESQTLIVSEGYSLIFVITCSALQSDFSSCKSNFDKSINSFEILNEPSKGSFFEGLIIMIIVGAVIGGIAGGIVASLVYSKKKKNEVVEVEPIEMGPIYQTGVQPFKTLEEKEKLPPPPPPPPPPNIPP